MVIIGGRDLSTAAGDTFDGVRERTKASSLADDNVDSIDCLRSECEVRGRGMKEVAESRSGVLEGVVMNCCEAVVGPAEGGGERNWNCWEGGPTRNSVGEDGGPGDDGADKLGGNGGIQSSV